MLENQNNSFKPISGSSTLIFCKQNLAFFKCLAFKELVGITFCLSPTVLFSSENKVVCFLFFNSASKILCSCSTLLQITTHSEFAPHKTSPRILFADSNTYQTDKTVVRIFTPALTIASSNGY